MRSPATERRAAGGRTLELADAKKKVTSAPNRRASARERRSSGQKSDGKSSQRHQVMPEPLESETTSSVHARSNDNLKLPLCSCGVQTVPLTNAMAVQFTSTAGNALGALQAWQTS